jgi:hypothetical protein
MLAPAEMSIIIETSPFGPVRAVTAEHAVAHWLSEKGGEPHALRRRTQEPRHPRQQLVRRAQLLVPASAERTPSHPLVERSCSKVAVLLASIRRPGNKQFASAILPPWARKTPKISEVLPLLYPHGLSTGDFIPALESTIDAESPPALSGVPACW